MPADSSTRSTVLIVDDTPENLRVVSGVLKDEFKVRVATNGPQALALLEGSQPLPDLILLDNHLPGVRGVDAIAGFKEVAPEVKILMLTVSENEQDLSAALKAGADGYLLKTINAEDLSDSILKVLEGESVISPEMTTKLVAAFRTQPPAAEKAAGSAPTPASPAEGLGILSARELETLALIARGASNKVIARELDIAETTVKIHVQHILRKLNLSSRVQAAVYAASHGIG